MTNFEAINYLIRPTQTSTKPLPEYLKQQEAYQMAIEALSEKRQGKWIPVTNGRGGMECSQCHDYAPSFKSGAEWLSNYCPNCGAKMRGDAE